MVQQPGLLTDFEMLMMRVRVAKIMWGIIMSRPARLAGLWKHHRRSAAQLPAASKDTFTKLTLPIGSEKKQKGVFAAN